MNFAWTNKPIPNLVLEIIFIVIFIVIFNLIYAKVVKRKFAFIGLNVSLFLFLLCYLFSITAGIYLSSVLLIVCLSVTLFINLGDLRRFLANPFKRDAAKTRKVATVEKIFDRKAMYEAIEKAVINFSKNKTGAIITLEKNTSLADIIKNGVPIHAPVSAELLDTIFYPGTRLHDGAVVIHGNEIVAASVFYTPTTKTFAVKFGSRHRAALGISEISDAVTIVVSEETGRISFVVNGQLDSVEHDNFMRMLEFYMNHEE